jgi:AcrR family transcriptional regulator
MTTGADSRTALADSLTPARAGSDPPMRADARRNRSRILDAAAAAFAQDGLGVPVDEIARRAGVGAGTLYRHFPTKEALFEAVIVEHIEGLVDKARSLAESDHPGTALFEFLGYLAEVGSSKRNLVDALAGAGIDIKANLESSKRQMDESMQVLLRRAQAAGEVRPDVTLADLLGLVIGACMFSGSEATASQDRMIAVVCDGLRMK